MTVNQDSVGIHITYDDLSTFVRLNDLEISLGPERIESFNIPPWQCQLVILMYVRYQLDLVTLDIRFVSLLTMFIVKFLKSNSYLKEDFVSALQFEELLIPHLIPHY